MFEAFRSDDLSVLTFNVTWFCPVKCVYCYRARSVCQTQKVALSKDTLIQECTVAREYGIKEYRISGGEPISMGDQLFEYADIIRELTGTKPILMTSGWGIDNNWIRNAANRFSAIAVSVDNPLDIQRSSVNLDRLLDLMNENACSEVPFTFGLTLVKSEYFKDIPEIFNRLHRRLDYKSMPQLDYACLRSYSPPNARQIEDIRRATANLFSENGLIPNYFVYMVGSLLWLREDIRRIVLNLHPEGTYQIYDSVLERWEIEYKWQDYIFDQQKQSAICANCEWMDSCRHHPLWELKYDWCELRKALFEGMYEGLRVE